MVHFVIPPLLPCRRRFRVPIDRMRADALDAIDGFLLGIAEGAVTHGNSEGLGKCARATGQGRGATEQRTPRALQQRPRSATPGAAHDRWLG